MHIRCKSRISERRLEDRRGRHKCTWVDQKGTQHAAAKDVIDQSKPTFRHHVSYPIEKSNKQNPIKEVCFKKNDRAILLRIGNIVINGEND